MSTLPAIYVLAVVSAVAATVLAFIFILSDRKKDKLNKFGKLLHDICNFKTLILEKLLQAIYIFATTFCVLAGLFMLISFDYCDGKLTWHGGYGLLLMILGPVVIRLVFELVMMFILLVKNVIQINNKLKDNGEGRKEDVFSLPSLKLTKKEEIPAEASGPVYCIHCGARLVDGKCPACAPENQNAE